MHISKIIDYVKNEINFSQEFCEDNVFVTLRIEPILRIIDNLEQSHKDILKYAKEIEKKDRQIDLMALAIINYDDQLVINRYKNINEVKQCFERKVRE